VKAIERARARASYAWRGARLLGGFVRERPTHLIVQVSNRCNLTCGFCSFWERPAHPRDEMTLADFERISAVMAEAGSMIVSIEGGEPLLRPDIVGIVAAFARYHHPILFTNGWRVTAELARALWDAGLTEVGVSIDYPDAERHDRHRGVAGTYERALAALAVLRDSAPHGRRQVTVMTVLMDDNAADFEGLLQLSDSLGVNHQCTLISTFGDGRHDRAQQLAPGGVGARLLELKRRYPHFVTFSGYLGDVDRFLAGDAPTPCHAGERFLNIDHLGEVSPCIEKLAMSAGNIRRDPWPVIRARLEAMRPETRACQSCHTSCKGFVEEMSGSPGLGSWREFFKGFAT
jgi:MoaA/NifB/PqqE/SkfB family radical SAM enzyme